MLFVARRYLFSPKSHSVVNIICCVSVVSLLMPVAAVIVLLSVFNGFSQLIGDVDHAVEGDLTVEVRSGHLFERSQIDVAAIEGLEGVEGLSFATEQMVMLRSGERSSVARLRGVDEEYASVVAIEDHVVAGEFDLSREEGYGVVVSGSLMGELKARALDEQIEILALKTGAMQSLIPVWQYASESASVGGVVQLDEESGSMAYGSQELVEELVGRGGIASRLMIKVANDRHLESTQRAIQQILGDDFSVKNRAQMNPTTYNIVRYEKLGVGLICGLVMVLASFSLLGALTMLIIEKRDDVATLRAMGASAGDVRRIFLLEGGIISLCAVVLGVALGCGVTLVQQYIGIVELPSQSMVVNYYPVELMTSDVAWVVSVALLIAVSISWLTVKGVKFR
ncbi:MAG: FtsX-like permease family protein [Rikenellaceae bacterium]